MEPERKYIKVNPSGVELVGGLCSYFWSINKAIGGSIFYPDKLAHLQGLFIYDNQMIYDEYLERLKKTPKKELRWR
jgi:hypothetical protein